VRHGDDRQGKAAWGEKTRISIVAMPHLAGDFVTRRADRVDKRARRWGYEGEKREKTSNQKHGVLLKKSRRKGQKGEGGIYDLG